MRSAKRTLPADLLSGKLVRRGWQAKGARLYSPPPRCSQKEIQKLSRSPRPRELSHVSKRAALERIFKTFDGNVFSSVVTGHVFAGGITRNS